MNCSNCKIANQNVPCVPQGNDFKIAIVLKEKIKTDGEMSERDIDIASISSVAVIKPNGDAVDNTQNQVYSYALNGSTLILDFANQEGANALPKGNYGVDVKGVRDDADDSNFRFYLPPPHAFNIVNSTIDGRFPSDSIITYTVNGVVGVALNVSEGGGGSATVGTLKTDNTSAQTPSASESFGDAINLHKVSKTGSYDDLLNKPTIPDAQVQADWNQTTTTAKDYIKNKPTIPSVSGLASQEWVNEQNFLKQHQDITGKEDKLTIESVASGATAITAEKGKYYTIGGTVGTLTITLPYTASATKIDGLLVYFKTASSGVNISIVSATSGANSNTVVLPKGLEFEADTIYELSCVFNGAWVVGYAIFEEQSNS